MMAGPARRRASGGVQLSVTRGKGVRLLSARSDGNVATSALLGRPTRASVGARLRPERMRSLGQASCSWLGRERLFPFSFEN
jgi:hypothetical protein